MNASTLVTKITRDLAVSTSEEFDRNFERKGFFEQKWPARKFPASRGTLMSVSGNLRRSVTRTIENNQIHWKSTLPYAVIHNEGGQITVTPKMKKFFWAMYYKTGGAITMKQDGSAAKTKRNEKLTGEAANWKALALMPVGKKMEIKKRQFIGEHPKIRELVMAAVDRNLPELDQYIKSKLKI